ncbi:MAG: heat-inducible transcriptional repressor HrcA [Tissierellia bacterium]|nr:heat-inducible transcriptional repressor HrcA [Tissierellia bacterium]
MLNDQLTSRQKSILFAVIQSFIEDGEPMGSRTLAKKYDIGVSPATIRNDMSDLEDLGYLSKSHISSGRIPSELAYRAYVKRIMEDVFNEINTEASLAVSRMFSHHMIPWEKMIESAAKILSELTGYTIVSMIMRPLTTKIVHSELIAIDPKNFCLVNLYETGDVTNSIIRVPREPSVEEVKKMNFYLNSLFTGKDLLSLEKELKNLQQWRRFPEIGNSIYDLIKNEISEFNKMDIHYEGLSKIFEFPEYSELSRAKAFIQFIEDEENIENLFIESKNDYLDIKIGTENKADILHENTVMTSTYFLSNSTSGKIAVIAPTRMKYKKTIEAMMKLSWKINNLSFNY